jgi:hypothetical protein
LPPLLVLPVPDVPLVPDVPELDVPLVPDAPAHCPLELQGGEQHSLSDAHDEPGEAHAMGDPPSIPPSFVATVAQRPARQELPCSQSVSTVHPVSALLQATTTRIAARTAETTTAPRTDTSPR